MEGLHVVWDDELTSHAGKLCRRVERPVLVLLRAAVSRGGLWPCGERGGAERAAREHGAETYMYGPTM